MCQIDPLEQINLGTSENPKPVYISKLLLEEVKKEFVQILSEFRDCFDWDYLEMPGLPRDLVEHRLPIKEGFVPFKQPPRRMSTEVSLFVKKELECLLKVGFIRITRYVQWFANIVPVVKKNRKIRVCMDFRNLNTATPKDEYPMPMANLMVDGVAIHKVLSFMDGHSG